MLNRVSEKTAVVVKSREASTVDAISAALVESEEGNGGDRLIVFSGMREGSASAALEELEDRMACLLRLGT